MKKKLRRWSGRYTKQLHKRRVDDMLSEDHSHWSIVRRSQNMDVFFLFFIASAARLLVGPEMMAIVPVPDRRKKGVLDTFGVPLLALDSAVACGSSEESCVINDRDMFKLMKTTST